MTGAAFSGDDWGDYPIVDGSFGPFPNISPPVNSQQFWNDTLTKGPLETYSNFVPEGGFGDTRGMPSAGFDFPWVYEQPRAQPYIYKMPNIPEHSRNIDPSIVEPGTADPMNKTPGSFKGNLPQPLNLGYTMNSWEDFPEVDMSTIRQS